MSDNKRQATLWEYAEKANETFYLKDLILQYADRVKQETGLHSLLEDLAFQLIKQNSNAFLFGLISDQSVKAEIAWSLPYRLLQRLTHLDIELLSDMDINKLSEIIRFKPALHRYPTQIAKHIILACQKLKSSYDCRASKIWEAPATAATIVDRLEEFSGIGHKKASLGVMLLVRDFNLVITDTSSIDIAYDVHIRRVFLRSSQVADDTSEKVLLAARTLYPDYPGLLTTPFWLIGRNWCHATNPSCFDCPINLACTKKI